MMPCYFLLCIWSRVHCFTSIISDVHNDLIQYALLLQLYRWGKCNLFRSTVLGTETQAHLGQHCSVAGGILLAFGAGQFFIVWDCSTHCRIAVINAIPHLQMPAMSPHPSDNQKHHTYFQKPSTGTLPPLAGTTSTVPAHPPLFYPASRKLVIGTKFVRKRDAWVKHFKVEPSSLLKPFVLGILPPYLKLWNSTVKYQSWNTNVWDRE